MKSQSKSSQSTVSSSDLGLGKSNLSSHQDHITTSGLSAPNSPALSKSKEKLDKIGSLTKNTLTKSIKFSRKLTLTRKKSQSMNDLQNTENQDFMKNILRNSQNLRLGIFRKTFI